MTISVDPVRNLPSSTLRPWIAATAVLLLLLPGCGGTPKQIRLHGEALGTFYAITVADPPANVSESDVRKLADNTLDRINVLMSTYREDSELSRFNRHEDTSPFLLSPETYAVFSIAGEISEKSGGAFDITVGPLVNAWGFGPDPLRDPPTEEQIRELLSHQGYEKLRFLENYYVAKEDPKIYCDLSAVAKGYAVDAIAEAFEAAGLSRYMIEVGGELRVAGKNDKGQRWGLGIEKPLVGRRELETVVFLEKESLATSGDYRNSYELGGKRISHTIDPATGHPVQHALASVSVIHPSCAYADGYATALMVLGPEKGLALAEKEKLAVMMLVHDEKEGGFQRITTPAFDAYLTGE